MKNLRVKNTLSIHVYYCISATYKDNTEWKIYNIRIGQSHDGMNWSFLFFSRAENALLFNMYRRAGLWLTCFSYSSVSIRRPEVKSFLRKFLLSISIPKTASRRFCNCLTVNFLGRSRKAVEDQSISF